MDGSKYQFLELYDQRHLLNAAKVNDLARACTSLSWNFDLNLATESPQQWQASFQEIINKLQLLDSAYVVPLFEGYLSEGAAHLVFPYYEGAQTLLDRISQYGRLPEDEVRNMLFDLLQALKALETAQLHLGQLQAKSIIRIEIPGEGYRYMLQEPCVVRFALTLRPLEYEAFIQRNAHFIAPESIYDMALTPRTDLFLLAQLAYTALAGGHPLYGKDRPTAEQFFQTNISFDCSLNTLSDVSPELAIWLEKALTFLPNKRPSIDEALASLPQATTARVAEQISSPQLGMVPGSLGPGGPTMAAIPPGTSGMGFVGIPAGSIAGPQPVLKSAEMGNSNLLWILLAVAVLVTGGAIYVMVSGIHPMAAQKASNNKNDGSNSNKPNSAINTSLEGSEPGKITGIRARASSVLGSFIAANAVDGIISDRSRWIGQAENEGSWIILEWDEEQKLQGVHLYSGLGNRNQIKDVKIQFRDTSGNWIDIPSASLTDNEHVAVALHFDETVEVKTNSLKFILKKTNMEHARVKEIVVWKDGEIEMSELP